MPKPENVIGKGKLFSSTNQPRNRGRKPSLYTRIQKLVAVNLDTELSKEDYFKLIAFLMEQPIGNLKTIGNDKDTPIWIVNLIRSIVKDTNEGRMTTLNSLLDRMFGKPQQNNVNKNDSTIEMKGHIPINEWIKDRLQKR